MFIITKCQARRKPEAAELSEKLFLPLSIFRFC